MTVSEVVLVSISIRKVRSKDVDVKDVIYHIHENDIEVMANYIFGLPGDSEKSIRKTFNLSLDLCTSGWNTYAAMALPGSKLYYEAMLNGIKMPDNYVGYSFHSYNTLPLPTKELSAAQILSFRDQAFIKYHTNRKFLDRIENKFGVLAKENILNMTKIKLRRKITENQNLINL